MSKCITIYIVYKRNSSGRISPFDIMSSQNVLKNSSKTFLCELVAAVAWIETSAHDGWSSADSNDLAVDESDWSTRVNWWTGSECWSRTGRDAETSWSSGAGCLWSRTGRDAETNCWLGVGCWSRTGRDAETNSWTGAGCWLEVGNGSRTTSRIGASWWWRTVGVARTDWCAVVNKNVWNSSGVVLYGWLESTLTHFPFLYTTFSFNGGSVSCSSCKQNKNSKYN